MQEQRRVAIVFVPLVVIAVFVTVIAVRNRVEERRVPKVTDDQAAEAREWLKQHAREKQEDQQKDLARTADEAYGPKSRLAFLSRLKDSMVVNTSIRWHHPGLNDPKGYVVVKVLRQPYPSRSELEKALGQSLGSSGYRHLDGTEGIAAAIDSTLAVSFDEHQRVQMIMIPGEEIGREPSDYSASQGDYACHYGGGFCFGYRGVIIH